MKNRDHDSGYQETELERLFLVVLPGTKFAHKVFAVGGYVRDELVGTEPNDMDVVVEVQYGAQRFVDFLIDTFGSEKLTEPEPISYEFPIWHIQFKEDVEWEGKMYAVKDAELDLADTQTFVQLNGDTTTEFGTISEDVERRDFTVNMVFKDLTNGEIRDPTGFGKSDIDKGVLRTLPNSNALRDFESQPKRILRAIRFSLRYNWKIDEDVVEAMVQSVHHLSDLSESGIKKEFVKFAKDGNLDLAVRALKSIGAIQYLREAIKNDRIRKRED